MPYTDTNYPDTLKGLDQDAIKVWVETWNSVYAAAKEKGKSEKYAEGKAFSIANGNLKKTWQKDDKGEWTKVQETEAMQEMDVPAGSYEYVMRLVSNAWSTVREALGMPESWVDWTFPDHIVVSQGLSHEKYSQVEWWVDENGDIQFGQVTPVDVGVRITPAVESEQGSASNLQETILLEAEQYDKVRHRLVVTVIKPGFNTSKERYYQPLALSEAVKDAVFNNVKMFEDHDVEGEPPVRSVRKWASTLKETWLGPNGEIKGAVNILSHFRPFLQELEEAGELGNIGLSINAFGDGKPAVIDGVKTLSVDKIVKARSVDWVTAPGAGGGVDGFMESARLQEANWDKAYIDSLPDSAFAAIEPAYKDGATKDKNARHLPYKGSDGKVDLPHLRNALARVNQIKPVTDSITAAELRKQAAAVLDKAAKGEKIGQYAEGEKKHMDQEKTPLTEEEATALKAENAALKEQVATLLKEKNAAKLEESLAKGDLPDAAKERIHKLSELWRADEFESRLIETVKDECEYLAKIKESAAPLKESTGVQGMGVKGMGVPQAAGQYERDLDRAMGLK